MKNKKVVLSVLSAAVVSSMATSALAAPSAGVYLGGNVDKYYKLENFIYDEVINAFVAEADQVAPNQLVYVTEEGKAITLQGIIDNDDWEAALEEINDDNVADFFGEDADDEFKVVGVDGQPSDDVVVPGDGSTGTPVDLKVESVSATNATTVVVDFNKDVPAGTFTFNGTAVAAANVAIAGDKATLTVPSLVDETEYTVVFTPSETGATALTSTFKYDLNEIRTLTVQSTNLSAAVGTEASLTVKLVDEDGDPIANKEVKAQLDHVSAFEQDTVLTATTDANGLATFTWKRNNTGADTFDVYVVDKATVRVNGTFNWLTAGAYVTVDAVNNVTLGDGTAKEYTVTARTASGANYTGAVLVDFAGDADTDITAAGAGRTLQVEFWNGTAWVNAGASLGKLAETNATRATVTLAAADNGQFKIRVYNTGANRANVDTVTPTFWYDTDANGTLGTNDPRAVGGTVSYVAQTPSITITPADSNNTLARSTVGTSTKHLKDYTVEVKDQFGNPFRGTVDVAQLEGADAFANTTALAGLNFSVDLNEDGDFSDTGESTNTSQEINFAIEAGNDTDTKFKLQVNANGAAAGTTTPVVFVDTPNTGTPADVDDFIDANDTAVSATALNVQTRAVTNASVTSPTTGDVAVGGNKVFVFTFTDQFGDAITPADLGVALEGASMGTIDIAAIDQSYDATAGFVADITPAPGTTARADVAGASNVVAVQVDSGSATNEATVRVYVDGNDDDAYQVDELSATGTVKFVAGTLSGGALTAAFANGTIYDDVATATGVDAVAASAAANANEATVTYTLQDQAGQAFTTSTPVTVTWTVTNNGTTTAQVDAGSGYVDLAAGATATYTTTVAAAASTTSIKVDAKNASENHNLTVTAQAAGVQTAASAVVAYSQEAAIAADPAAPRTINGTIIGIQKDGLEDGTTTADNNDGTILVVKDSLGQIVAINLAAGNAATKKINGTTVSSEGTFESNILVGDTISISLEGEGAAFDAGDTITITR